MTQHQYANMNLQHGGYNGTGYYTATSCHSSAYHFTSRTPGSGLLHGVLMSQCGHIPRLPASYLAHCNSDFQQCSFHACKYLALPAGSATISIVPPSLLLAHATPSSA